MLTILLCSRMRDDATESHLVKFFKNIQDTVLDKNFVQILVKFDDDDSHRENVLSQLHALNIDFKWDHIVGPRGNGYLDLYKSYNEMLYYHSLSITPLYHATSDDMHFTQPGWDQDLRKAYYTGCETWNDKIFTIHQEDRFFGIRPSYKEILERNEPLPFWTKEWIFTLGMLSPTTASDAFTSCLEMELFDTYKIDPRIILDKKICARQVTEFDLPGNNRHDVVRSKLIQQLESEAMREMIKFQALNIFNAKQNSDVSFRLNEKTDTLENFFNHYGKNFILHEAFKKILSKETDVHKQAEIVSKLICLHAIPTMQRSADWIQLIRYLFHDVFNAFIQETNSEYVLSRLHEYYIEIANEVKQLIKASSPV